MQAKYQLVTIGHENSFRDRVVLTFLEKISELGLSEDSVEILTDTEYWGRHKNNAPTVAVYFGGVGAVHPSLDIVANLLHETAFVLPVVEDLNHFSNLIPNQLNEINGFELANEFDLEPLVSSILEGFSLLRAARRVFISYRRTESTGVAIQLYEEFERAGFDVFLDTHSVRPGDNFQEELWHRLADTDVLVMLNTPGFCSSKWTTEELAKASGMSIAILQLVWPNNTPLDASQLTIPVVLSADDFDNQNYSNGNATLFSQTMPRLVSQVEGLRARALAARQDNLTTEFKRVADRLGVAINLQPQKYLTLDRTGGRKIIIPTIGVPQAFTYNQSDERVRRDITNEQCEVFLLYDHKNIKESWLNHLDWLDSHLPVKTFRIVNAETWLGANR